MSAPDHLIDHVTQEIRQQMESILALKSRLAGPLPAADALACDEGVASTGDPCAGSPRLPRSPRRPLSHSHPDAWSSRLA